VRSIRDDLETLDDEASERLDEIFQSIEPTDHASRILRLAELPEMASDILEFRERMGWKSTG
jgi:hypothetical protein